MTLYASEIQDLGQWCEEHDCPHTNIGQGLRWGLGLASLIWIGAAMWVASC